MRGKAFECIRKPKAKSCLIKKGPLGGLQGRTEEIHSVSPREKRVQAVNYLKTIKSPLKAGLMSTATQSESIACFYEDHADDSTCYGKSKILKASKSKLSSLDMRISVNVMDDIDKNIQGGEIKDPIKDDIEKEYKVSDKSITDIINPIKIEYSDKKVKKKSPGYKNLSFLVGNKGNAGGSRFELFLRSKFSSQSNAWKNYFDNSFSGRNRERNREKLPCLTERTLKSEP
jgi:hypothetical protein